MSALSAVAGVDVFFSSDSSNLFRLFKQILAVALNRQIIDRDFLGFKDFLLLAVNIFKFSSEFFDCEAKDKLFLPQQSEAKHLSSTFAATPEHSLSLPTNN